ncbi:MAG: hypothetical protein ACRDN0_15020 [Trebonia sp.]
MSCRPTPGRRDYSELLSEIYNPDKLARDPRTTLFLEAGKRLLRDLLRDADGPAGIGERPPFEEVLAWLTRRSVVEEACRAWQASGGEAAGACPTEAAYRYRWHTQSDYLRDLVITALAPRMEHPEEVGCASGVIDAVRAGERLADAIGEIAATEVRALSDDPAFRLQMVFQATLAHDDRVAYALHLIDKANVEAWTEFARQSYGKLGLAPRKDVDFRQLGCALHAAGQGIMFRAMLAPRSGPASPDAPAELLALIAKALIIATADRGDGKTIDEILDQVIRRSYPDQQANDS